MLNKRLEDSLIVNNQLSSQDLLDAFKLQLAKDFEQSNFPAEFVASLQPGYEEILAKIALELQRNEKKTDFNIMHLLYRVDISESQLKRYLDKNKDKSYFSVIAELIVKRVLQKVVIKQHYKNHESS